MASTRRASRKAAKSMKGKKSMKASKARKPSSWAMTVKKVYADLKKKMGKKATLGMAMKQASRDRKH